MNIDSLTRERCLSCGARDRTIRLWKIVEESQLVFRSDLASVDCIKYINEDNFISGSDNGFNFFL